MPEPMSSGDFGHWLRYIGNNLSNLLPERCKHKTEFHFLRSLRSEEAYLGRSLRNRAILHRAGLLVANALEAHLAPPSEDSNHFVAVPAKRPKHIRQTPQLAARSALEHGCPAQSWFWRRGHFHRQQYRYLRYSRLRCSRLRYHCHRNSCLAHSCLAHSRIRGCCHRRYY